MSRLVRCVLVAGMLPALLAACDSGDEGAVPPPATADTTTADVAEDEDVVGALVREEVADALVTDLGLDAAEASCLSEVIEDVLPDDGTGILEADPETIASDVIDALTSELDRCVSPDRQAELGDAPAPPDEAYLIAVRSIDPEIAGDDASLAEAGDVLCRYVDSLEIPFDALPEVVADDASLAASLARAVEPMLKHRLDAAELIAMLTVTLPLRCPAVAG